MKAYITNKHWASIYSDFINVATVDAMDDNYTEAINFSFSFDPVTDNTMSYIIGVFDPKKAAKMFFWYKKADKNDASITDYFSEYKRCIDENHDYFNSNYGIYAYRQGGLKFCVDELKRNHKSRQACFCINKNAVAIKDFEIDKLCTNVIQFFIRDARLEMVVQMRSSNFIALLPYDAFMFSVFYFEVYKALKEEHKLLRTGKIHMQIASLHYYKHNEIAACIIERWSNIETQLIDFTEDINKLVNTLNKYTKQ
jgi:thymidylate synthase|nr:MAG TPA: hypothetical protein [Caudoviricetes sp.]